MRKLKLQMQMSLDGFVAGPNGELDWMTGLGDEISETVDHLAGTSDVILMGRGMSAGFTTYWENVVNNHPESPEHAFALKMVALPKIVFSKTLNAVPGLNTRVENGDLAQVVHALKARDGKDLLVYGGATFVSSLLMQNLIDELHIFIHPVAIGEGLRIFNYRADLRLIVSQPNPSGVVINTYVPEK